MIEDIIRYWLTGAAITWLLMIALHRYNRERPGTAAVAALLFWLMLLPVNLLLILITAGTLLACHFFHLDNKTLADWWRNQ